jgi:hypothetical protein
MWKMCARPQYVQYRYRCTLVFFKCPNIAKEMPGSKSALALLYLTLLWMVVQMVAVPFIAVRQRLPISHANHQSQATLSGGA